MGIRGILSKPLAHFLSAGNKSWIDHPEAAQEKVFKTLIETIRTYEDFKKNVPVREYEGIKAYVDLILEGRQNILWPGKPLYLAKTSGTTSGSKYIPITKESIPNHINSTRNALMDYIVETGKSQFLDKKLIFLSGSPVLAKKAGIHIGRLSGIVNHHVPAVLRSNQLPSYETNCMEDWESKVDKIVEETYLQDMSLISGIPSWVQMYFEKLKQKSGGKSIHEIFPNFSLFIYGGVNYEPYRTKFEHYIGRKVDSIELFPASEGFFAYQNQQDDKALLLMANSGIFYEFIPADEYFSENPTRLNLSQVKTGINYALVISSNAGLWSYSIGDMVRFTSIKPYKLIVAGRIKHYTSAFGEHVIAEEVEDAMQIALSLYGGEVNEFHVAPMVNPTEGLPYHEWLVEFGSKPSDLEGFSKMLDETLQTKNTYYKDLIQGKVLKPLVVTIVKDGSFISFMKSEGKLGGQNKLPRLANDRKMADQIRIQ